MRTRTYGGVVRVVSNDHPYPISCLIRRDLDSQVKLDRRLVYHTEQEPITR